ncbi:MAG: ketoacyl-ACP synthase III [Treponema sp.]|jgi:3-oxoacyl-[acyl-carrier-protein] synthase-3|nr:ketoacyl-ACP synthase III [Treponema sp.]
MSKKEYTVGFEIIGTGKAVPPKRVTNDELAKTLDTNDEWIRSHTGIGARHIADDHIACSDLAVEAARNALSWAIERQACAEKTIEELALTVDMVIVGSSTTDYFCCPATACIVQNAIGAKNAGAMDVVNACSSFIYGLETGAGLLSVSNDRRRALVIGAEVLSRFVDWTDRGTCVLFGDGAGAVLLEKTNSPRGISRTILGADGSGAGDLIMKQGGSRYPFKKGDTVVTPPHMEMNGRAVYNFAVGAVTETITTLLKAENLAIEDVALIVPHQANARIVQAAAKRLNVPEGRFFLNIEEYANTSSASIPIALDELNRSGALRTGDLILCVAFGAGLTYGGSLIRW